MKRRPIHVQLIALACGAAAAISTFALFLQPLSGQLPRTLLILALLWALFSALAGHAWVRAIAPALAGRSLGGRIAWAAACLAAGALATQVVPLPGELIHFLFPRHSLKVEAAPASNPASGGGRVEVRYIADGEAYLFPLDEWRRGPGWVRSDEGWANTGAESGAISWSGSLLNRARLALSTGPAGGMARITWDGETREVDLYTPAPTELVLKLGEAAPGALPARFYLWLAFAAYTLAFGYLFLALSTWLAGLPLKRAPGAGGRAPNLLPFALPMAAAWGVFWLTFYPAVLSKDSIDQWRMVYGLQPVSDWHPAIHTLIERLLAYVWNTPAAAALAQILALALVSAWGIAALVEHGLPRPAAWALAALFALSPANSTMAISLWKDIPYAISLLALFIIGFKVAASGGGWLGRRLHWAGLGLACASAGLFRHNGLAVVILLLGVWLAVYRSFRRPLLAGAGLFAVLWWLVSGPLYSLAGVQREANVLRDTILLHHFGAHVKAGTPLTDAERDYFNRLRPIDTWEYSCCRVDPLFFPDGFDRALFAASSAQNLRFFIDLASRAPLVSIRHQLCAGSIVWRVCRECNFLEHKIELAEGQVRWIGENDLGFKEDSRLPVLVRPLSGWALFSTSARAAPWLWGPAFYLYLFLFCLEVYALRLRSWKALLIGLAPALQSLILAAVNIAPDFRYQYGVYLIGLLGLGLLVLPPAHRPETR